MFVGGWEHSEPPSQYLRDLVPTGCSMCAPHDTPGAARLLTVPYLRASWNRGESRWIGVHFDSLSIPCVELEEEEFSPWTLIFEVFLSTVVIATSRASVSGDNRGRQW